MSSTECCLHIYFCGLGLEYVLVDPYDIWTTTPYRNKDEISKNAIIRHYRLKTKPYVLFRLICRE